MSDKFFIEDIKLNAGDQPPDVLDRVLAPSATIQHLRRLVRKRLGSTFEQKSLQAVRLIDSLGGELYRWTWFDEDRRRQKLTGNVGRRRAKRSKSTNNTGRK